jgi:hypothetical protein
MQTSNHQAYLAQRNDPKVIVPRDNHAYGAEITLTHAPMSHPSVQAYLRDAQTEADFLIYLSHSGFIMTTSPIFSKKSTSVGTLQTAWQQLGTELVYSGTHPLR